MIDRLTDGATGAVAAWMRRLDLRIRLVALAGVVLATAGIGHVALLLALLAAVLALAALASVSVGDIAARLAHVEGFLVLVVVLLPLTAGGPDIVQIGPVGLSEAGVLKAVQVVLKVNIAALAILTLVGGASPVALGHALAGLGAPDRLIHLLLFSARYVDVLRAETVRLRDALRARGFRPATTRHAFRTLASLAGLILVRALERAERVDEAMRLRGYAGRLVLVAPAAMTPYDRGQALAAGLAPLALLVLDRFL